MKLVQLLSILKHRVGKEKFDEEIRKSDGGVEVGETQRRYWSESKTVFGLLDG